MDQDILLPRIDPDVAQAADPYLLQMVELERAARVLDIEDLVLEQLRHAELEVTIHLPVARSDGAAANVSALHCMYSHSAGCITELTIAPDVFLNHVRASAYANDLSCALLELPLRGGAAGIICDLSQFSEREMRQFVGNYCRRLRTTLPSLFAFSQMHGGNQAIHGWFNHELGEAGGRLAAVRQAETQWAHLACWIGELIAAAGKPELRTYAIQGCGGLGLALARSVSGERQPWRSGNEAKVVMMSDASGAAFNEDGLDIARLESHVLRERVLFGFPGAEHAYGAELPQCPCDVLVLQAPMQVTAANASRVQAKLIVECAPECVSHEAKALLAAEGVEVIPEILVRSGMVLLSAADSGPLPFAESRVRALLRRNASRLASEIRPAGRNWKTGFAGATLALAIERRANQIRRAGI